MMRFRHGSYTVCEGPLIGRILMMARMLTAEAQCKKS